MVRKLSNFFPFRKKKRQQMWKKGSNLAMSGNSVEVEEMPGVLEETDTGTMLEEVSPPNATMENVEDLEMVDEVDLVGDALISEADAHDADSVNLTFDDLLSDDTEPALSDSASEKADSAKADAGEPAGAPEPVVSIEPPEPPVVMLDEQDMAQLTPEAASQEPLPAAASAAPPPEAPAPDHEMVNKFRRVEGSVEKLKQEALTAGELRRTIEGAMQKRLEITVEKIQQFFKQSEEANLAQSRQEADTLASIQALEAQLKTVSNEFTAVQGALQDSLASAKASETEKKELRERLPMLESRLVAWLERINVSAGKQVTQSEAWQVELRQLLQEMLRLNQDNQLLKKRLYGVKGALGVSLSRIRAMVAENFFARTFVGGTLEDPLQAIHTALNEFDAVLKDMD